MQKPPVHRAGGYIYYGGATVKVILPSEGEIRRLYMSGYTVKQIITMVYSCTAKVMKNKVMKKDVAHYVERVISTYHYWEEKEE